MSQESNNNESGISLLEIYSNTIEMKSKIEMLEKRDEKLDLILDRITDIQSVLTNRLVAVEVQSDNLAYNHDVLVEEVKHVTRNSKIHATVIGSILVAVVGAISKVVFKA